MVWYYASTHDTTPTLLQPTLTRTGLLQHGPSRYTSWLVSQAPFLFY